MNALPEWMRPRVGYKCGHVFEFAHEGEVFTRPCGRCRDCIAIKKRDVAGRAAAEAAVAAQVVVWTLTYRDGEAGAQDFVLQDRQRFMQRIRDHLLGYARRLVGAPQRMPKGAADHVAAYWKHRIKAVIPRVRYLGCGERGSRGTKRCHWHICVFLSKPGPFVSTPREADGKPGRENHWLWPHGFMNCHVLPDDMSAKMRAVRYAVKYLDKARVPSKFERRRGVEREARFFRSSATPLGFEYLTEWAREHARQGLPLHATYRIPGVTFSRAKAGPAGREVPKMTVHIVHGRMREHCIEAYKDEWAKRRGHVPVPMTDFMMRFDPEAEFRYSAVPQPVKWRRRRDPVKPVVEEPSKRDCSGLCIVNLNWPMPDGTWKVIEFGSVEMRRSGFATFMDAQGVETPILHGNLLHLSDVRRRRGDGPWIPASLADRVERWIAEKRGPGWMSPQELALRRAERFLRRREALLALEQRSPSPLPAHRNGMRVIGALARKFAMFGDAYVPGAIVRDSPKGEFYQRGEPTLKRSIHARPC